MSKMVSFRLDEKVLQRLDRLSVSSYAGNRTAALVGCVEHCWQHHLDDSTGQKRILDSY